MACQNVTYQHEWLSGVMVKAQGYYPEGCQFKSRFDKFFPSRNEHAADILMTFNEQAHTFEPTVQKCGVYY